jgi:hypothetical protein
LDDDYAKVKREVMGVLSHSNQDTSRVRSGLAESSVAAVIVNYRTADLAKACIKALAEERSAFRNLSAVLVDGGSGDGSADKLSRFVSGGQFAKWVNFLPLPLNGGFGWANNQAIQRLIRGSHPPDYIYLLNPDAEVEAGAIRWLVEYLDSHARVAAVGSQLLEAAGGPSGSAFRFPSIGTEFARGARTALLERFFGVKPITIHASEAAEVDWVTGASVMLRVAALREVGLFDEGFFLYHDEVELMWRLRKAGWLIATEPKSRVRHVGGAATGVHSPNRVNHVAGRSPAYLYRSRTRFFGLTRGRLIAVAAFLAWIAGDAFWKGRRLLHLAAGQPQVEHELGDHLLKAFPRRHDFQPAIPRADGEASTTPAWKEKGWL